MCFPDEYTNSSFTFTENCEAVSNYLKRKCLQVYDTAGTYLYLLGSGFLWLPMVLLSEIVQTFILADFCYYYVKRFALYLHSRLLV